MADKGRNSVREDRVVPFNQEDRAARPLDSVPGLDRPMSAGPNDTPVGEDELGNPIYRNPTTGLTYTVRQNPDQRTLRTRVEEDVIPAIAGYLEGPTLPTAKQVGGFAKDVATGTYEPFYNVARGQGTLGEVLETASGTAAASLPFEVPEGSLRIFGGRTAKNFPDDLANEASRVFNEAVTRGNLSPEEALRTTWEETGVWLGDDTGALFEIPNQDMRFTAPAAEWVGKPNAAYSGDSFRLTDIVDFPSLFEAYPSLRNTEIRVQPGQGAGGSFDGTDNVLNLTEGAFSSGEDELRNILLHELQHGVQAHEGWSGGANDSWLAGYNRTTEGNRVPGYFYPNDPYLQDLAKEYNKALQEYADGLPGHTEKSLTDEYYRIHDIAFRRYLANEGEVQARASADRDQLTRSELRDTTPKDSYRAALGEALEKYRGAQMPTARMSHPQQEYAKGGFVPAMDKQMEMAFMSEGGMVDDGKNVEPTTGNEVPPGSLSEEVKDHVSAKLSPGEYVLPADVVQFYGLDKIEKMVGKAKDGLQDMDERGRIGGKNPEEDELPFEDEELMSEEEEEAAFAEGGVVAPQTGGMHNRVYIDESGAEQSVLFIGNMPLGYVNPKWRLKTEAVQEETKAPETTMSEGEPFNGDQQNDETEGPKSPSEWTLEDFQKFDPSSPPFEPVSRILPGLGSLLEAGHKHTTNRAYSVLEERLKNPDLSDEDRQTYTKELERYSSATGGRNKEREADEEREWKGLLSNVFGEDGFLNSIFNPKPATTSASPRTSSAPAPSRTAPTAAPAGLGGSDNDNAPTSSPRPQARPSTQQTKPAKPAVKASETRYEDAKSGAYSQFNTNDPTKADFAGRMYAEGGLVARPKRRKPKAK
jgi:hypothetical protein